MIQKLADIKDAVRLGVKPAKELNEYVTSTGVYGPCPLMRLEYFDPIRDSVIDMMHTGAGDIKRVLEIFRGIRNLTLSNDES